MTRTIAGKKDKPNIRYPALVNVGNMLFWWDEETIEFGKILNEEREPDKTIEQSEEDFTENEDDAAK